MAHKDLNSKVLKLKPTLCQGNKNSCSLCYFTDVHSTEFPLIKLKPPVSTSMTLLQEIWIGKRMSLKLHLEQFHDDTGGRVEGGAQHINTRSCQVRFVSSYYCQVFCRPQGEQERNLEK